MASQQQPLKAPFPPPPSFYEHFTQANLAQLRRLRSEAGSSQDASKPEFSNIPDLPSELRYLIPPKPPTEDNWKSFAQQLSQSPAPTTLQDSGIEQLYPPGRISNPQPHLIALARSLLTTFLSLSGILSVNPTLYAQKVDDLQTICYNMHELINQYRPHQARESLIVMMEERVHRLREETRRAQEGRERVEKLMGTLAESKNGQVVEDLERAQVVEPKDRSDEGVWRAKQRVAWAAIEESFR